MRRVTRPAVSQLANSAPGCPRDGRRIGSPPPTSTAGESQTVEISNGVGPVRPADRGCAETFVQLASKTFTLTATGRDGRSESRSLTVTVNIPSPEISLSVNPESIQTGETARELKDRVSSAPLVIKLKETAWGCGSTS